VWQSERNFGASTASALGLCAASSVARINAEQGRAANPTGQQDRGYGVTSALALVVEAVEALAPPLRL
jgi:hypothetical protein